MMHKAELRQLLCGGGKVPTWVSLQTLAENAAVIPCLIPLNNEEKAQAELLSLGTWKTHSRLNI